MHQLSPASPKLLGLTLLPSVGLLSVPKSTLAGVSVGALSGRRLLHSVRMKAAALRDENLCIIRARNNFLVGKNSFCISRRRNFA